MTKKTKLSLDCKDGFYKVRDIALHQFGRNEINLAHSEMPGLMALRREFGGKKPLEGVRISGSLHMTIQTAVLIETLHHLGADIRWCSCNIFSTQDHAAAAIAKAGTARVFAWKGESVREYWRCLEETLAWPDADGPDLIVDDGGDATLMVHEGVLAEEEFERSGRLPALPPAADPDALEMALAIRASLQKAPARWRKLASNCRGVSEETTTGVARLRSFARAGRLLFPAINVNDSVTKSKFDNIYGVKHSLPDGIKRATDVLLAGKTVLVCGYGDVGKGAASAMKAEGAKVIVSEVDPICALQACMEGFAVERLEDVVGRVDVVVTCTGNKDVVLKRHMEEMKNNAIVCNIGHFDNEIETSAVFNDTAIRRDRIKPQVDRFVFPDGHGVILLAEGRLVNLGCATGHPSLVMSHSFTNQVLAQLELWERRKEKKIELSVLPKRLDEKVARLHLDAFGAKLTRLTEEQSKYIDVPLEGPFKNEQYRY